MDKDLRTLLKELHDEIETTQAVDEDGSKLLIDLEADIAKLLERSGEKPVEAKLTDFQDLSSIITHFEVTHPNLTGLISKLSEFLSSVGI
jgi:hypothetical protein